MISASRVLNTSSVIGTSSSHSQTLHSAIVLVSIFSAVFACANMASAETRVEAYRGEPFGIGRVTIDLAPGSSSAPANDDRFVLTETNDRTLYPVMRNSSSRRMLRDFLGIETPLRVTFYFMFRG